MRRRKFITATSLGLIGIKTGCGRPNGATKPGKKRETLIKTNVLVVGGGPAGIGAAIGAAKAGADTLLIENHGFFGGVASWGLGMVMNQMKPDGISRGYVHELLESKLDQFGAQSLRIDGHRFYVNVEFLKAAILDALDETGCRYLVHARAVDSIMEGKRVTGVVIATKSGLAEIHARQVIDCTGDADIAYYSGAPVLKEEGNLSPSTLLLNIGNIESHQGDNLNDIGKMAKKKYPLYPGSAFFTKVAHSNFYAINHAGTRHMGSVDITDPFRFSEAECMSRRQVIQMTQAIQEYAKGPLQEAEIHGASPQLAVRESRRIKGAYILSEDDARNGQKFEDVVAWRSGFLDIGFTRLTRMKVHDVPYRSLVPDEVDGLLAAGRCISATHEGASAGKSMGNCFATGHAAGIAAAMASRSGKQPRELDVKKIQEALRKDGVDLDKGGSSQEHIES